MERSEKTEVTPLRRETGVSRPAEKEVERAETVAVKESGSEVRVRPIPTGGKDMDSGYKIQGYTERPYGRPCILYPLSLCWSLPIGMGWVCGMWAAVVPTAGERLSVLGMVRSWREGSETNPGNPEKPEVLFAFQG